MRHSVSTTALRAILVMAIAMVISPAHLNAQDNAEQWDQFKEHDDQSALVIDHAPMTAIIKAIAVRDAGSNKLAFSALTGKTLDYLKLYIRFLEQIPVSTLNRNEQLAYWLNLHNAAVWNISLQTKNCSATSNVSVANQQTLVNLGQNCASP